MNQQSDENALEGKIVELKADIVRLFEKFYVKNTTAENLSIVYLYGLEVCADILTVEQYYLQLRRLKVELEIIQKAVIQFEKIKEEAIDEIGFYKDKRIFLLEKEKLIKKYEAEIKEKVM